jgi:glutamate/aspartate transport system substrate-binding protein
LRRFLFAAFCALVIGTASSHAQSSDAVLDRIKQNGAISIGHREASIPFSYLDGTGKPVGYSIDICLKIAEAMKNKLGLKELPVKFVAVNL